MGIYVKNSNTSAALSLTALRVFGLWAPRALVGPMRWLYTCYSAFSFLFLLGIYIVIQIVDLCLVWGELPLMTGTAFLLLTNLAQAAKVLNLLLRRRAIQDVIDDANRVLSGVESDEAKVIVLRCDWETRWQQATYLTLTLVTLLGWAASAEEGQLPLRAWYPYDTRASPAHEATYAHQVAALTLAAGLNVAKDSLATTLCAQARCRLQLLQRALADLSSHSNAPPDNLTIQQELLTWHRLRDCVHEHQKALDSVVKLQDCFSAPTFAQLTVSLVIICVSAFQLISLATSGNVVRLLSMGTYLLNMCFQVLIYCYQGTLLTEESAKIANAAYECSWYSRSVQFRRSLLVVMVRSRRVAQLTAGGFTKLSLGTFTAIIKASYSLFTLLQQVEAQE